MNQNHKKREKHINIQRIISKPMLILMHPNYYAKTTNDFNYFTKYSYFTNQLINLFYTFI